MQNVMPMLPKHSSRYGKWDHRKKADAKTFWITIAMDDIGILPKSAALHLVRAQMYRSLNEVSAFPEVGASIDFR